jgi:methionyl-tRNA synthetase
MRPFYVTTPIYYVNDKPHIGHAYTTIAADVLARYQKLRGRPTRFLTGTDEHGIKIEQRARELGKEPQAFVDEMAPPFRAAFDQVGCAYDDFIRTTEPRHEERVKRLWKTLEERGDIYLGEYEGWYSVADEAFVTETELEALDPVTRSKVIRMREKSYFFRLKDWGPKLMAFYEAHPKFVQPEGRFNEVKAFVREGLHDLSISRTTFRWGIEVPGNPEHVMYVWLDALTNYISALGGPAAAGEAPLFDRFWGKDADQIHIVGKDILRFHAVYWPAFLLSAGIEPPGQVWAHGWLTVDGQKMSKRLGNFIPPGPLVEELGADVVRYYLMREVGFGQDGDFSHHNLLARYHGELGNGLGNLLNRMVASIVKKNLGGRVPNASAESMTDADRELVAVAERSARAAAACFDDVAPHRAIEAVWELVAAANRYVDATAPWKLAKEDPKRLETVAYTVLEALRWLGTMLWPVMPEKCDALLAQLGLPAMAPREGEDIWPSPWGGLSGGTETRPSDPLFPRFDEKREALVLERLVPRAEGAAASPTGAPMPEKKPPAKPPAETEPKGEIAYEDFKKLDLRVGTVRVAERVPKSDKLLRLEIDLGEPAPRQVLAGIGKQYAPESLVGKRVVVVANLAPRKMMGLVSHGMVLSATDADGLSVLATDRDVEPGSGVS